MPPRKRSEREFCAPAARLAVLNVLTVTNPQRNVETSASVLTQNVSLKLLRHKPWDVLLPCALFCLQSVSSWSSFLEPGCVQSSRNRYREEIWFCNSTLRSVLIAYDCLCISEPVTLSAYWLSAGPVTGLFVVVSGRRAASDRRAQCFWKLIRKMTIILYCCTYVLYLIVTM